MAKETYVRITAVWRRVKNGYVKVAGVWKDIFKVYVRVGGIWKQVHLRQREIVISADTSDYDIFVAFGSPTNPAVFVLTVDTGVVVSSSSTAIAALKTGTGFPAGSSLRIVNNGDITGMGGLGGTGETWIKPTSNATVGLVGGPSMDLGFPVSLDNTNGNIYGGGGGGGGGDGAIACLGDGSSVGGGGGGGGGAGGGLGGTKGGTSCGFLGGDNPEHVQPTDGFVGASIGGAGGAGGTTPNPSVCGCTISTIGGAGGAGGGYGLAGADGLPGVPDPFPAIAVGGGAGKAIDQNGNAITWLGGNNSAQVKGVVS